MPTAAQKEQMDLFAGGGEEDVPSFEPVTVRAARIHSQIALAVSEMLKSAENGDGDKLEREDVARRMGEYLGESVSKNVLNAYASQARNGHNITVARLCALMHATNDFRLLKLIAEMFDLTVIPRRYETAVRESILAEKVDQMQRELDDLRRRRAQ